MQIAVSHNSMLLSSRTYFLVGNRVRPQRLQYPERYIHRIG